MVSILISLNWQPIMHNLWIDNQGVKLILDYDNITFRTIAKQLIDTRIMFESIRASSHFCGAGMEHGIDWEATLVLIRDFKDKSKRKDAENSREEELDAAAPPEPEPEPPARKAGLSYPAK